MRVPAASSTIPRISAGFMLSTFVILPCMMRKLGLLMLSCTLWNRFCIVCSVDLWPFRRYLDTFPTAIWRVTVIWDVFSKPTGDLERSWLLNTMVTDALVTPAWPLRLLDVFTQLQRYTYRL